MAERKYWVISPNVKNGEDLEKWLNFISENNYVFMGYQDDHQIGYNFKEKINKGDIIIARHRYQGEHKVYIAGIVDSDCSAHEKLPGTPSKAYNRKLFPYITKMYFENNSQINILFNSGKASGGNGTTMALYQLHPEWNGTDKKIIKIIENELKKLLEEKYMDDILQLLEANKNLILTGAPGTGKTHLAEELACKFIFSKEKKLLSDDQSKAFKEQHELVQFHPSYDYTDFVEGLRPSKPDKDGNIKFELKDGIFKEFCKKAAKASPEKKFVFVIDEINRGEISKIFGELFLSIDPGYRGEKVKVRTQYQNMINKDDKDDPFCEGFYVPNNVYIIGTMNDIDRSVESFDFAMRRRFVWHEITAEESKKRMNLSEETKNRMAWLNKAIEETQDLGRSYHIGGSYFFDRDEKGNVIRDKNNIATPPDYEKLWDTRLKPLLSEYIRGFEQEKDILEKFKKAYDNTRPQDESE